MTYDLGLLVRIDILGDNAEGADGGNPDIRTLGINDQDREEREEIRDQGVDTVQHIFKYGIQDVYTNFAVGHIWRAACLLEEGKEFRPLVERHLYAGDGGNHASSGVPNKVTNDDFDRELAFTRAAGVQMYIPGLTKYQFRQLCFDLCPLLDGYLHP